MAPGWVDTALIAGRLNDPREKWAEAQATVPLRKIAQPQDVARTMAFLASHRAAGHITGQCLSVDGGMEGRIVWRADEALEGSNPALTENLSILSIAPTIETRKRRVKVLLSVDFDAVSGFLGLEPLQPTALLITAADTLQHRSEYHGCFGSSRNMGSLPR